MCYDDIMRTTVTIDPDTAALLQEEVQRTGQSFKKVLNAAVRKALAPRASAVEVAPLFTQPFPDTLGNFNRLADSWDDEETLKELNR